MLPVPEKEATKNEQRGSILTERPPPELASLQEKMCGQVTNRSIIDLGPLISGDREEGENLNIIYIACIFVIGV
ncbi:hypothetical protein DPMN_153738 [Dreissena polymorpha]|uniref:Uncharacterized protein n=1 Tax=Dreissena polymorpha TaxID=45954 RepID=A0A9D4FMW5_DREPO|nr:hypothetical protein DPMN_153738 [Dreissena polymorpha]